MDATLPDCGKALCSAVGVSVEFSIPLALVGATPGARVSFRVLVQRRHGEQTVELQRIPERMPVVLQVPLADWSARQWRA